MSEENRAEFCPLTQKRCRDDCAWYHIFVNVDETGADQDTYCAISVIANALCDIGEEADWDEW